MYKEGSREAALIDFRVKSVMNSSEDALGVTIAPEMWLPLVSGPNNESDE